MEHSTSLIIPFSDIRATDLPLVGGKGANLGEMTYAGFPIPTGFCLTTVAFHKFIESSSIADEIYESLDAITSKDLERVRVVGKEIRQKLLEVTFPKEIAEVFRMRWQQSGANLAYSVRSSATAEDLPDASFAGQQDTYLNVIGEPNLLDAIKRCWVSLFTDRAILYRCQHNFSHRDVLLSVVVQTMVQSETSGILFTADPLTGHRHTLSIDASFGLGEALVSGLVNPDAYKVDKINRKIIAKQVSEKNTAIISEKDGGTRQETLSEGQRNKTVLTEKQILELTEIGCNIESHYGAPQDIEWAFANNEFYVLQSRPITSLYPIDAIASPDDSLQIYFSFGHQQMMTDAMPPLALSTFQCIIPFGRPEGKYESTFTRQNGGRMFGNLTNPLRHPILRKVVFEITSQFDALAPKMLQQAMRHPNFKRPHGISIPFRKVLGMFYRIMRALWWQKLDGYIPKMNKLKEEYLKGIHKEINETKDDKQKITYVLESFSSMVPVALNWVPQFIASEMSKRLISKLASSKTKASDLDALSLGLHGNVVTEMNLAVGNLADLVRKSPEIVDTFKNLEEGSEVWLEHVSSLNNSNDFLKAWNEFLDKYGSRGPSEIDIMVPKWCEEPLPLLQMIAGYLQKESGSHLKQHQKLIEAREAASKRVVAEASWLKRGLIKRLIYVLKEVGGLREHHKFLLIQNLRTAKEMLREVNLNLVQSNKLASLDDIWFLTWPELLTIWDDNQKLNELIPKRKEDFERFPKLTPPTIITSDGETPVVQYEIEDVPEGALVGQPVSGGVVEGVIRVVNDPQTEMLNTGEILVATFTDPGWTPLFINAGGLILEIGGIMTHGSVVAREYGIPAVVGVKGATTKLQTGQRVRIDGNQGIIEIL